MKVKNIVFGLYLINFLLFLFGWILIICGGVVMNQPDTSNCAYVQDMSVYMLVVGCVIVVVSLIGCVGISQKNICLLLIFVGLLLIVFFFCLVLFSIGFSLRGKVGDDILVGMKQDINSTRDVNYIDKIQKFHKCCGISNYTDWRENIGFKPPSKLLPLSCCVEDSKDCREGSTDLYVKSCGEPYKSAMKNYHNVIAVIATAAAIFVLIEILFVMMLVSAIREEYNAL